MKKILLKQKDSDRNVGMIHTRQSFRAWVLMLAMVAFILPGCSSGSNSSDDTGDDTNTTASSKSGVYEQDGGNVTESGMTYAATQTDESAVYVYGAGTYTLTGGTMTKTGDNSSEEDSNFYGNNAIVLAEGGSIIYLDNCSLTSDSDGSNGAFAYEAGSEVNLTNCTISTTGDSARGVDATYGGTINISDSTITTTGAHCSVIATDRYDTASGAPEVNAYRVTGEASGDGSAGIYSTGIFYVEDCTFTADATGGAVIEGSNSITLEDSHLIVTDLYSSEDKFYGTSDTLTNSNYTFPSGGQIQKL